MPKGDQKSRHLVTNASGFTITLGDTQPMNLDNGTQFGPFDIAYQTYGVLNAEKSNVILICHALTGDQYVASEHPVTGKPGWWDDMVGAGKPIDTERFFVICINALGGCMGSAGPKEIDPKTNRPYGLEFPVITIADMVRAQKLVIEQLGIGQLFCVVGGSMGAMQVLEWASRYKDNVFSAMPIAGAARHTAQNIAFHEVGRQAILADPDWHGSDRACGRRESASAREPNRGSPAAHRPKSGCCPGPAPWRRAWRQPPSRPAPSYHRAPRSDHRSVRPASWPSPRTGLAHSSQRPPAGLSGF